MEDMAPTRRSWFTSIIAAAVGSFALGSSGSTNRSVAATEESGKSVPEAALSFQYDCYGRLVKQICRSNSDVVVRTYS